MELCSIEDAFPDFQKNKKGMPKPGCTDAKASKEERRAARKLAKKCKDGPAEEYYKATDDLLPPIDADRPAMKRLGEIPAFASYEDAFSDMSGSKFEGFKMPTLPAANCLISQPGYPSYFGKGLEDADEGFTNMFNDSPTKAETPETFEYEFGGKGAEKAGGLKALPAPSLSDAWKPMTPAKTTTSFFKHLPGHVSNAEPSEEEDTKKHPVRAERAMPPPSALTAADGHHDSMRTLMANQIKELTRRFDDLEVKRQRNTQKEIILFVGTGVFILVCMDLVTRMARR